MDRLIFFEGGFPVTTETLEFIQDSYASAISALSNVAGDKVILQGVVSNGSNYTAGFITHNKEIFPFRACPATSEVFIVKTEEMVTYEDDQDASGEPDEKPAYVRRYATTAPAEGDTVIESFLAEELVTISNLRNSFIPVGGAILWFDATNIPKGYKVCNGLEGTPDLRNRFIKMAGNENQVNTTGGANSKKILNKNLPAHTHSTPAHTHKMFVTGDGGQNSSTDIGENTKVSYRGSSGGDNDYKLSKPTSSTAVPTIGVSGGASSGNTDSGTGEGENFNVEPAFYTAIWIQFKGF